MSDEAPKKTTISITIDGRPHEAKPGQLVIDACEDAGTYVPRFCYHRRMEPVGMCRQCLVEIEGPRGTALVVSCMTPVGENQIVLTETPTVKKAQEGVLEFLLANHPLDCPVCDKGGECPLQDQAFSHGPGESRFVEEKRHFAKPIPISDLVLLDRERCILCDRCTRFAKDVAGDPLIHFVERGNNTQVMTFPNEPFASYFSGNTVQICPVGALTATPYRFKARPWDLTQTESTCTTCSVGCRITVQSSRDELLRYQGVDSDPVNWGWLCDKGRFGFEAINSAQRVERPLLVDQFNMTKVSWADGLDAAASALRTALDSGGPSSIAALGGARLANEDAYVWAKLLKGFIGTDNVDAQLGDGLPAGVVFGLPAATIDEACAAPTIVLLGPDLKEELPVLYLRVRDVAAKRKARVLELSPVGSGLTPYAWKSLRYKPGEQAAAVRALAGNGDPNVLGIGADELAEIREQFDRGAVAVIAGRASLAESEGFTADALATMHQGFPSARFLVGLRRGNVRGALDLGLTPGFGPGHVALADAGDALRGAWPQLPTATGLDARGILEAAAAGKIGCLLLLGADPLNDFPDRDLATRALAGAAKIVVVDTFVNDSAKQADVVLPAAAFSERAGTTTNLEGRVSTLSQKVTPRGNAHADWIIAADLAARLGHDLGVESLEQIRAEIAELSPLHVLLTEDLLRKQRDGVVVGGGSSATVTTVPATVSTTGAPLPNAYDFRLVVSRKLYDSGVTVAQSRSLAALAPGASLHLHPLDVDRLGVPDGTLVKVSTPRTSLSAAVTSSAAVPRGSAWMAFNQADVGVGALIDSTEPVIDVRVETL
jgi:NADH-quinone oxidoreductase subunit G